MKITKQKFENEVVQKYDAWRDRDYVVIVNSPDEAVYSVNTFKDKGYSCESIAIFGNDMFMHDLEEFCDGRIDANINPFAELINRRWNVKIIHSDLYYSIIEQLNEVIEFTDSVIGT